MLLAEILEAGMLICFGLSWPMNAWKAYKARTAAGTSWQFLMLICLGYGCGVAAKFSLSTINWVVGVYLLNCAFLAINWAVYFRNRRLDAVRSAKYSADGQPSTLFTKAQDPSRKQDPVHAPNSRVIQRPLELEPEIAQLSAHRA